MHLMSNGHRRSLSGREKVSTLFIRLHAICCPVSKLILPNADLRRKSIIHWNSRPLWLLLSFFVASIFFGCSSYWRVLRIMFLALWSVLLSFAPNCPIDDVHQFGRTNWIQACPLSRKALLLRWYTVYHTRKTIFTFKSAAHF